MQCGQRLHAIEVIGGERRAVAGRGGRHDRRPLRVTMAGGCALLLLPRHRSRLEE